MSEENKVLKNNQEVNNGFEKDPGLRKCKCYLTQISYLNKQKENLNKAEEILNELIKLYSDND